MVNRVIFFIFFCATTGFTQESTDSTNRIFFLSSIVNYLADDSLYGRPSSSIYEIKAADFIFRTFKSFKGLKVKKQVFTYALNDSSSFQQSQNIYCYLNHRADSTIVIGAHYDHIGYGGGLSLAFSKKNQIHNGADDNASGVALMLLLAKNAKMELSNKYNYIFVAYSAHEIGLFGSTAFLPYIQEKIAPIKCMINFDMVGRMDFLTKNISVYVSTTFEQNTSVYFEKAISNLSVYLNYNDKILNTDCRVFLTKNIPSVSITTGIHNDYHKPSDDSEKINYYGMLMIYDLIKNYINK